MLLRVILVDTYVQDDNRQTQEVVCMVLYTCVVMQVTPSVTITAKTAEKFVSHPKGLQIEVTSYQIIKLIIPSQYKELILPFLLFPVLIQVHCLSHSSLSTHTNYDVVISNCKEEE